MENGKLNTSGFVSKSFSEGGSARLRSAGSGRPAKKRSGRAAFILVRLGVCAAAFLGILALKFAWGDELKNAVAALTDGEEERAEDSAGRLRFVELPSIIEVFAPSDKAVIPVGASAYELAEDGYALKLEVGSGAEILSPVGGRIGSTGVDPKLGRFVTVLADGGVEFAVYGFAETEAEKGQTVKQRQRLGTAFGSAVTVRAWKDGRPLDAAALFGLGTAG